MDLLFSALLRFPVNLPFHTIQSIPHTKGLGTGSRQDSSSFNKRQVAIHSKLGILFSDVMVQDGTTFNVKRMDGPVWIAQNIGDVPVGGTMRGSSNLSLLYPGGLGLFRPQ